MTGTCVTKGRVRNSNRPADSPSHAVRIGMVRDVSANLALIKINVSINYFISRPRFVIHHFHF